MSTSGLNVSLTEELAEFTNDLVESGRYGSKSEVVRSALRLLQDRERHRELKLQVLREEIQEGLESGPAEPWDAESFLEEAHRRHEGER